jgi:hypothetical protein
MYKIFATAFLNGKERTIYDHRFCKSLTLSSKIRIIYLDHKRSFEHVGHVNGVFANIFNTNSDAQSEIEQAA